MTCSWSVIEEKHLSEIQNRSTDKEYEHYTPFYNENQNPHVFTHKVATVQMQKQNTIKERNVCYTTRNYLV
jgi:hypothetical protein